jgi:hypothetical protein
MSSISWLMHIIPLLMVGMESEDSGRELMEALKGSPWWAKAPSWLALGIVGVPSLIAIGAVSWIIYNQQQITNKHLEQSNVIINLAQQTLTAVAQHDTLSDQRYKDIQKTTTENNARSHALQVAQVQLQLQQCVNSAKSLYQTNKCITAAGKEPEDE